MRVVFKTPDTNVLISHFYLFKYQTQNAAFTKFMMDHHIVVNIQSDGMGMLLLDLPLEKVNDN